MSEDSILETLLGKLDSLLKLGESISRPYVAIDLFPRGFVNLLYMRIRNLGKTPALNVRVEFDQDITIRGRAVSEYRIFDNIPVLAPGDSLSFLFGSAVEILNDEEAVKRFSGRVYYTNFDGVDYSNQFDFNLEIYRNLVLVYDYKFEQDIKNEMEQIRRELQEISRYYRDLRNRELFERWEGSQEQASDEQE